MSFYGYLFRGETPRRVPPTGVVPNRPVYCSPGQTWDMTDMTPRTEAPFEWYRSYWMNMV